MKFWKRLFGFLVFLILLLGCSQLFPDNSKDLEDGILIQEKADVSREELEDGFQNILEENLDSNVDRVVMVEELMKIHYIDVG